MSSLISDEIDDLHDLRAERDRIEAEYKDMERNWYTVILPGREIGERLLLSLWQSRKSRPNPVKATTPKEENKKLQKGNKMKSLVNMEKKADPSKQQATFKQKAKRFGRQALIWQAVSLAFFIGATIYFKTSKRKKSEQ